VPDTAPTISTHVLDTGTGFPAADIPVRLWRVEEDGRETVVGEARTDAEGRVRDLLAGSPLRAGSYRLEFAFVDDAAFFTDLAVGLRIDDASRSYHVPLLRAPFGLSTYRGS
jgi:5-hydroxyisourate hydrolase